MGKYDDIIDLPHHVSDFHKPMPIENRASQFAPFAALAGHDEAITETARITEKFKILSEDKKEELSRKLTYAIDADCKVRITYFVLDKSKPGGSYTTVTGKIKKFDKYENSILLDSGLSIPLRLISEILP